VQTFAQFGRWLRHKQNFLLFSVIAVGLPAAVFLVWSFGHYGDVPFKFFLFGIALCGGLLWGVIIWEYFEWQFPRLHEPQRSRQPDGTP